MQALYGYIGAGLTLIVGLIGVYLKGRKDASRKAAADAAREQARVSERHAEVSTTAKRVADNVGDISRSAVDERLQKYYRRD